MHPPLAAPRYAVSFTKYFWIAMPFALVPQLVAAHFLRRLISQKHRLIDSLASFDVDKAECREEFDRKFVMTVPWHLAMLQIARAWFQKPVWCVLHMVVSDT